MKIKCIRNERQLKAGTYIRAVINGYGRHWIERITVVGRPFQVNSPWKKSRVIKVSIGYASERDYVHLSTLGVGELRLFHNRLIPYSMKAWNLLESLTDVQDFARAISGVDHTEEEWKQAQADWVYSKLFVQKFDRTQQGHYLKNQILYLQKACDANYLSLFDANSNFVAEAQLRLSMSKIRDILEPTDLVIDYENLSAKEVK